MPNSLILLNHYILSNASQKIRQWALKLPSNTMKTTTTTKAMPKAMTEAKAKTETETTMKAMTKDEGEGESEGESHDDEDEDEDEGERRRTKTTTTTKTKTMTIISCGLYHIFISVIQSKFHSTVSRSTTIKGSIFLSSVSTIIGDVKDGWW